MELFAIVVLIVVVVVIIALYKVVFTPTVFKLEHHVYTPSEVDDSDNFIDIGAIDIGLEDRVDYSDCNFDLAIVIVFGDPTEEYAHDRRSGDVPTDNFIDMNWDSVEKIYTLPDLEEGDDDSNSNN